MRVSRLVLRVLRLITPDIESIQGSTEVLRLLASGLHPQSGHAFLRSAGQVPLDLPPPAGVIASVLQHVLEI